MINIITSKTKKLYQHQPKQFVVNYNSEQSYGLLRWFPCHIRDNTKLWCMNGPHGSPNGTLSTGSEIRNYSNFDATGGHWDVGVSNFLGESSFTCSFWYAKNDGTTRESAAFGLIGGSDATRCGAHLPWSDGTIYFDFGGASGDNRVSSAGEFATIDVLGEPKMNWYVFRAGTLGISIWKNGRKLASKSNAITRSNSDVTNFGIGSHVSWRSDTAKFSDFRVYKYELSDRLIEKMYDPSYQYDLYYRVGMRTWFLPDVGVRYYSACNLTVTEI